jgi:hypothetical protein
MRGWTLSSQRKTYTFRGFTLQPGAKVTMHTGEGTDSVSQLFLSAHHFIWGDTRDVGRLRDASGLIVDRCTYHGQAAPVSVFICEDAVTLRHLPERALSR